MRRRNSIYCQNVQKLLQQMQIRKRLLPNKSVTIKMYVFSIYSEEKLSQLDKLGRKIVEKRISDILSEIEMSADMSAGGELNRQQQNPYSGFNSIPQQGQQGSCNIQGQSTWIDLTNDFLYFMQYLYMV